MLSNLGYENPALFHQGHAADIYRAYRPDGTSVIAKIPRSEDPAATEIAWLQREYELLSSLGDALGVIHPLGLRQLGERWALIEEDFGGESLEKLMPAATWSLADRLEIAIALADAVGQLHAANLIHKHLHPGHVVWNAQTKALKLIDLAMAAQIPRESAEVRADARIEGRLRYASPEQTGRVNRALDYRTDFYSMGATLYELFVGEPLWTSNDPLEILHSHVAVNPVPPSERNASIPPGLSALIMRLLEKNPSARYQSTYGLKHDLEHCRKTLAEDGTIPQFELCTHDVNERLALPDKLYGRSSELERLVGSFANITEARPSLVLISGYSGIGKSALARALYEPTTARRGYFISDKFEQMQRSTPYAAIAGAFGALMRQLLFNSESALQKWREALLEALGESGQIVMDVVPELALILGPQPPVAELGPAETLNRFNRIFGRFIRVLAKPEHPLVVFIDDLQWADSASLQLLEMLLGNDETRGFMVVGAYRDNEVQAGHPLRIMLDRLAQNSVPICDIPLGPLAPRAVDELISDTAGRPLDEVEALGRVVERKTAGNPLFVIQLLKSLFQDGLLKLDRQAGRWRWNVDEIATRNISDNVVDLVLDKLRMLPAPTQEALEYAACVGGSFDVDTLAIVLQTSAKQAFDRMLPAIREGFVAGRTGLEASSSTVLVRELKFLHDRIQQAAYALGDASGHAERHLLIGRLLRDHNKGNDRLFQIADQLNRARSLIHDQAELEALARMNLEAALRAKNALAYTAARSYIEAGLACLSDDTWQSNYELSYAVHRARVEIVHLDGNYELTEKLCIDLIERAQTTRDKAGIYPVLAAQYTHRAMYHEALVATKRGLALLDVTLPLGVSAEELGKLVGEEMGNVQQLLSAKPIADWGNEPEMTDPDALLVTALLQGIVASAFFIDPSFYIVVVCKAVGMSLRYGPSARSSDLWSNYAHIITIVGDPAVAYQLGRLAVTLTERLRQPDGACRSYHHLGNWVAHWSRPLRESLEMIDSAQRAGIEGGEQLYTGYAIVFRPYHAYYLGEALDEVAARIDEPLKFVRKNHNQLGIDILRALAPVVANLQGLTSSMDDLSFEGVAQADMLAQWREKKSGMAIAFHLVAETELRYMYDEPRRALAVWADADAALGQILGNHAVAHHHLYRALSIAAILGDEPECSDRADLRKAFDEQRERWRGWAAKCPENFAHLDALVDAEAARIDGEADRAANRYDAAIALANEHGFPQHAALASELAGKFWKGRGRRRIAQEYLRDALQGYRRRRAHRKVELLERRFSSFLFQEPLKSAPVQTSTDRGIESSTLDLQSILKLSHTITSEIDLDRLLSKLMLVLLENAGARHGALIFDKNGELHVEVHTAVDEAHTHGAATTVLESIALPNFLHASEPIIRYVARTKETVILGDATREGDFAQTPYVLRAKPKSLLCAPVMNSGRMVAIAYLENDLSANVFTPERLEILRLLSAQIATSLDIAILHRELETRVVLRTQELHQRNEDLSRALSELRKTQNQLVQSEKLASMGRLTMGIAHELKNPLNFIINFAKIEDSLVSEIEEELEEVQDVLPTKCGIADVVKDLKDTAAGIRDHGIRANDIVQSMMRHAAGMSGERAPTHIDKLLDQAVKFVLEAQHNADPNKGQITIERDYDPNLGEMLIVPQELLRVCINLIENAVDAVLSKKSSNGDAYAPTIRVEAHRTADVLTIRVRDNGPGVAPDVLPRIFEPFFTTKPPGKGLGLGLSLSYDIVVQGHHGTLECDSVQGNGATFVITLPT